MQCNEFSANSWRQSIPPQMIGIWNWAWDILLFSMVTKDAPPRNKLIPPNHRLKKKSGWEGKWTHSVEGNNYTPEFTNGWRAKKWCALVKGGLFLLNIVRLSIPQISRGVTGVTPFFVFTEGAWEPLISANANVEPPRMGVSGFRIDAGKHMDAGAQHLGVGEFHAGDDVPNI